MRNGEPTLVEVEDGGDDSIHVILGSESEYDHEDLRSEIFENLNGRRFSKTSYCTWWVSKRSFGRVRCL